MTIATAWIAIPTRAKSVFFGYTGENGKAIWQVDREESWGRTTYQYWRMQVSGKNLMMDNDEFLTHAFDLFTLDRAFRPESLDDIVMMEWYHAYGFPMRALRCEVHWVTQNNNAVTWRCDGGMILKETANGNVLALPMRPMTLGFAVNTLCYSALAWLLIGLVGVIRRRLRARRPELCPECRYDRTGLGEGAPCPECGHSA